MKRKQFIQSLAALPLTGIAMKLHALNSLTGSLGSTETMPALFLGCR
jgi:4,5-DOPA dioxygenase extradiol